MSSVEKLLIQIAKLQGSIMINNEAHDDDLAETWDMFKDEYKKTKDMIDLYIENAENN